MFKVGDEVVCVDAMGSEAYICSLRRGETYVVRQLHRCNQRDGLQLAVIPCEWVLACSACGARLDAATWHAWRFVKLPKLTVDQEDEVTA